MIPMIYAETWGSHAFFQQKQIDPPTLHRSPHSSGPRKAHLCDWTVA